MKKLILLSIVLLSNQISAVDSSDSDENKKRNKELCYAKTIRQAQDALRNGANIEAKCDRNGAPLLHTAVIRGNLDLVRFLLNSGANVNSENEFRYTALFSAASLGYQDIAELLLNNGANVDEEILDAVRRAAANGNSTIDLVLLLEKAAEEAAVKK